MTKSTGKLLIVAAGACVLARLLSACGDEQEVDAGGADGEIWASDVDEVSGLTDLQVEVINGGRPIWDDRVELSASNIAPDVTLSWWVLEGNPLNVQVLKFVIYVNGQLGGEVDGDASECTVRGLRDDTWYDFQVEAVGKNGKMSLNGPKIRIKTECETYWEDKCPASWPDGAELIAKKEDVNSFKLSWTGAYDNMGIVAYKVTIDGECICINEIPPPNGYTVEGDITEYVVGGLVEGKTYDFKIYACDAIGDENGWFRWIAGPGLSISY